jgi:hypothetical protein
MHRERNRFAIGCSQYIAIASLGIFFVACGAADSSREVKAADPSNSTLTPEQKSAIEKATSGAKADGFGLIFFKSVYLNLGIAGQSDKGDVALIAGSHSKDFPYYGTEPWDNGLLLVDGEGYFFTHRRQGEYLTIDLDTHSEVSDGQILYSGPMIRSSDNAEVRVTISFPIHATQMRARQLGKQYNFLDIEEIPGMRWQPYLMEGATGSVQIGEDEVVQVKNLRGEIEEGITSNLRAEEFAFSYDYISVARPGEDGYAFVDFVSHALDPESTIGALLEPIISLAASASVTLENGEDIKGNVHDVRRPSQSDSSVVLFETSVDLGLADLRRQMIQTQDGDGKMLYGLREIFEKKNIE